MTAPTHITFAEFIYLLILTTTGVSLNVTNACVIAVSSLLPDIDTSVSTVGKAVPAVSIIVERKFGHRTLTHSVACIVGLAILLLPLYAVLPQAYVCFVVGYCSHLLLDTMTINGVKLFYPFSTVKCVFPLEVNAPHRYRIQTGSRNDKALAIIFLIGCIPTFLIAYSGYERFIRATQQNIEAAVRDYNDFSKDNLVFAHVIAYSMLTKEPLSGNVEIVGALNAHTLIFRDADGRLHSIGKQFQADYVAEKILCERGRPARSYTRNLDMSNQLLCQIPAEIDTSVENYFFGLLSTTDKLSVPDDINLFSPVSGGDGSMKFNFATYDDIRNFNLEYAFISKGILTVKSILTGEHLQGSGETDLSIPKPGRYVQLSITVEAKDSIVFQKQKSDTVHENEIIARNNLTQLFQGTIGLNNERIGILRNQKDASASEFEQKIASALQALQLDSSEYMHNLELSESGYISGEQLQISLLKMQKDRESLLHITSARSLGAEQFLNGIHKLELENAQLRAKAKAAELQSQIRSPLHGVLIDIRKVHLNNKTQVTFIIRRTS